MACSNTLGLYPKSSPVRYSYFLKSPEEYIDILAANLSKSYWAWFALILLSIILSCFLWCHVRHINPVKIHPERTTQEDKKLVNNLNYDEVKFPVREKDFSKIGKRTTFALMCFVTKISWFFQFTFHITNLKTRWIYYS